MNHHNFSIVCLIAVSVLCASDAQDASRDSWYANTRILDEAAKYADPVTRDAASTLARDVKNFYQLLRDKKWHETYELRAQAFREDVPESNYLAEAKRAGEHWGLIHYEVLSSGFQNSDSGTNFDQATLICKFTELPDRAVSYSTVFWHKEDGVWKCLSAGPRKLSIFRETRPPSIDWK